MPRLNTSCQSGSRHSQREREGGSRERERGREGGRPGERGREGGGRERDISSLSLPADVAATRISLILAPNKRSWERLGKT